MQRDLFLPYPTATNAPPGLYADVVFDRPMDHPFTYGVADHLKGAIAVGKRVRVPFGRGDRALNGYCVCLSEVPPNRPAKPVLDVLDDEPLLTDDLLRLTRWMADYYLCSWGQVLNAVVPAGARDQAGTRRRAFVEAVSEEELSAPAHELPPRQAAALRALREAGRPVELKQLQRQAQCGSGPIKSLIERGLARRVVRRIDRALSGDEAEPTGPLPLNADQLRAWEALLPAVRAGGFKAFLLHGVT